MHVLRLAIVGPTAAEGGLATGARQACRQAVYVESTPHDQGGPRGVRAGRHDSLRNLPPDAYFVDCEKNIKVLQKRLILLSNFIIFT
jgi:hypothetical protein